MPAAPSRTRPRDRGCSTAPSPIHKAPSRPRAATSASGRSRSPGAAASRSATRRPTSYRRLGRRRRRRARLGPLGAVGLSISYFSGKDGRDRNDNELVSSGYEGGAYWRGPIGPAPRLRSRDLWHTKLQRQPLLQRHGQWRSGHPRSQGQVERQHCFRARRACPTMPSRRLHPPPNRRDRILSGSRKRVTPRPAAARAFDLTVDSRRATRRRPGNGRARLRSDRDQRGEDDGWFRVELEGGRRANP